MYAYEPPDPATALAVFVLLSTVAAAVLWPGRGIAARWRRSRRLSRRVLTEDALKCIAKRELAGHPATVETVAGTLGVGTDRVTDLLGHMQAAGLLLVDGHGLRLTDDGRDAALRVIRAHRLWERYLSEETGFSEADWHGLAEVREHEIDRDGVENLAAALGYPTHDPHGDPIPSAFVDLQAPVGGSLATAAAGAAVRVTHVEDEPEAVYAQLLAAGIHPGQVLNVLESTPRRIRLWTGDQEHVLAPVLAANVSVVPATEAPDDGWEPDAGTRPLAQLRQGESAEVIAISPRCRGAQRRRLMDLGLLPGAVVTAELVSPTGDPTAYLVRGALIALRSDQAAMIRVAVPDREAA